jgi:hypothetical protein
MSYPRELDEYSLADLEREMARRCDNIKNGICPYCGQKAGTKPSCRFPEQHFVADPVDESDDTR